MANWLRLFKLDTTTSETSFPHFQPSETAPTVSDPRILTNVERHDKRHFLIFGEAQLAGLRDLRGHTGQVGFHPSPDRYLMRRANSNSSFEAKPAMRQSALIAALVASAYALDNGVGPLGFHDVNLPTSGRCLSYPCPYQGMKHCSFVCEFPPNHIGVWVGNVKALMKFSHGWLVMNFGGLISRESLKGMIFGLEE